MWLARQSRAGREGAPARASYKIIQHPFHGTGNEDPIVLIANHFGGILSNARNFIRVRNDIFYRRRDLPRRVFVDGPTGRLFIKVALLVEEEVSNSTFLGRDNREPRRNRLDEGIPHPPPARGANGNNG